MHYANCMSAEMNSGQRWDCPISKDSKQDNKTANYYYQISSSTILQNWKISKSFPNQKLACIVLYLKINNTFLEDNICIL